MEKIFVQVQDSEKRSAVYVNLNHIVSVSQNGSAAVTISLSNGKSIPSNTPIGQFLNLIEEFIIKK